LDEKFDFPDRITVARKTYDMADTILEDKKMVFKNALQNIGGVALDYGYRYAELRNFLCAVCLLRKSDFLGAVLYWMDDKWFRKSALLAFAGQITGKTGDETWTKLCDSVMQFDVTEDLMKQQFFVTDEGQNICFALSSNDVICKLISYLIC
jgi:hypothetical protein